MKSLISAGRILIFIMFFSGTMYASTMSILVYPFKNTGDAKYSWLSAGITSSVISDLGMIREVTVISESDRKKAVAEISLAMSGIMDDEKAVKAGKILGANVIFTGSYLVMGDDIRIYANLVDVEKGSIIKTVKIDGTVKGLFDLQDRIVFTLMAETEKIRIADIKPPRLREEDKKKIETAERPKMSAYELYARGLEIEDTDPRRALDYFKQAIQVQPDYLDALNKITYIAGVELNLFDESTSYFKRADALYRGKRITDTDGYAILLSRMGSVYWSKGQLDDALEYFLRAQEIRESLGMRNTSDYAVLMNNIGCVHWSKGNLDNTLDYFFKAKKIRDDLRLNNTSEYATLINNIGLVYSNKGQSDKALEYYFNAKKIRDDMGLQNSSGYAILMSNMGIIYSTKGKLDEALAYHFKSKEVMNKLGLDNTSNYARLMINIGQVYNKKGKLDKTLEYYSKSKAVWDNLGLQNLFQYGTLLYNMAHVYEKQGNKDLAGEFFRKAYNTYVKAGYSGRLKDDALKNAERMGK